MQIVVAGLGNRRPLSELCAEHEISQAQYYKWRDQLLNQSHNIFETNPDKRVELLESKVIQLTNLVGELTVELKKTEKELRFLDL